MTASYLTQHGGVLTAPSAIHFGETPEDYPSLSTKALVTPLVDQGFLLISGARATELLQGQVTCDLDQLTAATTLTGVQCTPQGRMLCSFRVFQLSESQCLLQMHASLVNDIIDVLAKFAPFFQSTLSNASDDFLAFGISGQQSSKLLKQTVAGLPTANALIVNDKGISACQIDADRYQLVAPKQQAEQLWLSLLESATPIGSNYWTLNNIQHGLGEITAETAGMFIPQMLNFQATDAISFKKGCYTGQEIVARTKYLGKLKKRMYRIAINTDQLPAIGSPCLLAEQQNRIGNVINAAWAGKDKAELLVVLNQSAASENQLIIGSDKAVAIAQLEIPYSLDN